MNRKALIVYGGWPGHDPENVAEVFARFLAENGFDVERATSLDVFRDEAKLAALDLVVPHWTMGKIEKAQISPLLQAVSNGLGLAGIHGGIGDAFRDQPNWQLMVGGQFVAHFGGIIPYRVHIVDHMDPITAGMSHFNITSEQYYMHVDPSNHVLATTTVEANGCTMPVAWKRMHGKGRVFYSAVGHTAKDFDTAPESLVLIQRGMLWAAESRKAR